MCRYSHIMSRFSPKVDRFCLTVCTVQVWSVARYIVHYLGPGAVALCPGTLYTTFAIGQELCDQVHCTIPWPGVGMADIP